MSNPEISQQRAMAGIAGGRFLPQISPNPQQRLGLPAKEPPDLQRLGAEREAFAGSPLPTRRQRRIAARIPGRLLSPMTAQALTGLLGERVMKWTAAPNRFMLGRRKWIPSWRFQSCENLADAFQLLDSAKPETYSMGADETRCFWAKVQIGGVVGEGRDRSRPRAITCAVARASGIDVDHVG